MSGPGGAPSDRGSETSPLFISIKGYPEDNPKVIVKSKVMWRKGRIERHLSIFELEEGG